MMSAFTDVAYSGCIAMSTMWDLGDISAPQARCKWTVWEKCWSHGSMRWSFVNVTGHIMAY